MCVCAPSTRPHSIAKYYCSSQRLHSLYPYYQLLSDFLCLSLYLIFIFASPSTVCFHMSSSFTTYRSPLFNSLLLLGSTGVREGLKHQGKRGDIAFWHASYYFPFNFAAWRGIWDFLPPCISSSHPFSLSSCHNVLQVGRHGGWTDCTIPSNSLISFSSFIYGLSSVQQKWASTA